MTCEAVYYPDWSSRGMRAVQCHRRVKATVIEGKTWHQKDGMLVCGIHRLQAERDGATVVEGVWVRQ